MKLTLLRTRPQEPKNPASCGRGYRGEGIMNDIAQHQEEVCRNLLTALLAESSLYHTSKEFKELIEFTGRLRNVAPFNAMLLHIQRPGAQYVATAYDWRNRFGRTIIEDTRPLLILYPFGPVALVHDVADTKGDPLPDIVLNPFPAIGKMTEGVLKGFLARLERRRVEIRNAEFGAGMAGRIRKFKKVSAPLPGEKTARVNITYQLTLNSKHDPNQQFTTIVHELAHLFLGHLGDDDKLKIKVRLGLPHGKQEIEAEAAAYLVCKRNGIEARPQGYLHSYMGGNDPAHYPDLYAVMKAVGLIETLLGIGPEAMNFGGQDETNRAGTWKVG